MKKILITGANFNNKGAQSMLFVSVDEIRKRLGDVQIFFQTDEKLDLSNYRFEKVSLSGDSFRVSMGGLDAIKIVFIRIIKRIIKFFLRRPDNFFRAFSDTRRMKYVDLIIDISGFATGTKWGAQANYSYIYKLKFAQKNNIPVYIMPQSIGSFAGFDAKLKEALHDAFLWPKMILPREKDGVKSLEDIGIVKNVKLTPDLVLQNQGVDLKNIFIKPPELNIPSVLISTQYNIGDSTPDNVANVAIVPNRQCTVHGDKQRVLNIYIKIIQHLIGLGKNVYIIRHSNDDSELCKSINSYFHHRENANSLESANSSEGENQKAEVFLINQDLSCLEYNALVCQKNFSFVVGSRFHGLVHALRNNVPCIALGWAVKYKELLEAVGLGEYVFDATEDDIDEAGIMAAIDKMERNLKENKEIVKDKLKIIREQDCFGFLDTLR